MERMLEATAAAEDDHFWFRGLRRNAERLLGRAIGPPDRHRRIVDCGAGTGRNLDWLRTFGTAVGVEDRQHPHVMAAGRFANQIEVAQGGALLRREGTLGRDEEDLHANTRR